MKKITGVGIFVMLIIAVLALYPGCASAKFELSNMIVSPGLVGAGDVATITVDVTNVGNAAGDYTATLKVNDNTIDAETILVAPGVTEKVSFTVVESELGVYDFELGELTGKLTVVKPAKLELDALVIVPTEVLPGESAIVTVDASNTGGVSGTFEINLIVNGEKSQTKEVVMTGGETAEVIFTLILETAGLYDTEIDGLNESLRVLKPAEFQLSSLRISPTEVMVGQDASIKVDVLNSGEVEGTYTVTLEVNGKSVESREVMVGGGSIVPASFILVNNVSGNYRVAINGLTDTLVVSADKTDTLVVSADKYGGRVTIVSLLDIPNFDEVTGSSPASALTLQLTNEELVRGDWAKGPAGTNETNWTMNSWENQKGYIAESWEISEPGTIEYKIRQGIHYALDQGSAASRLVNGRELTADDVVFSLKRVISDPRAYFYGVNPTLRQASISAPDKWTVIIKVPPGTENEAMQQFGDFVSIIPPEVVSEYGDMSNWRNSVGTGPFMLTDYIDGSHAVLERNHNYWMKDPTDEGNQLPYIDSVIIAMIPDMLTRMAALRTGKIDQLSSITGEYVDLLKQTSPDLMSIIMENNPDPSLVRYNFWWPWLNNYHGELTVGYYNAIWPQYIWLDQDLKDTMGY